MIDSACTSTVAGATWMDSYLENLSDTDRAKVTTSTGTKKCRFGDGDEMQSLKCVKIPVRLSSKCATLSVDIVSANVPLLISSESLQRGNAKLDFQHHSLEILGQQLSLQETKSGHFMISLYPTNSVLFNSVFKDAKSIDDKRKKVVKLHRRFAHPPAHRLKKLLSDAQLDDGVIYDLVDDVTRSCETCEKAPTTPLRPVVGFPLATEFNETVAIDLKNIKAWHLYSTSHRPCYQI